MSNHTRWSDIRTEHVERAGGEKAVETGKQELLATVVGHRLAEIRRTRGLTQHQIAERMGVTSGPSSSSSSARQAAWSLSARSAAASSGPVSTISTRSSRDG